MNLSLSIQSGEDGSNFKNFVKSTVATSAIPNGIPGWPDLAFSIASIDKALIAFAIKLKSLLFIIF